MFSGRFVANFHIRPRQICVDELVVGLEFLGFVTFRDCGGVIGLGIISAAERELRIEKLRVLRENRFELLNRAFGVAGAEFKHCVVELVLKAWHLATSPYTISSERERRIN